MIRNISHFIDTIPYKIFLSFPAGRKIRKKFFQAFLPAGKSEKSFSKLSCRQENTKKVFPSFPADRKIRKKFFQPFLSAGKYKKSFFKLSCPQENRKKVF
ncbi:MAG: hypothetical protein LBQ65_10265 [Tannerellaceae bacterium]|jgi:hypothetical protein|nr:hypothetical protein [Tannerellaceae bacterium]